jgi:uncharacterized protein
MLTESPIVLVSHQLEQSATAIRSDECHCACPDGGFTFVNPKTAYHQPLCHPQLHTQPLPNNHTLMFNPHRDQGLAILNAPALQIWQQFETPRCFYDLPISHDRIHVVEQLVNAGLLEVRETKLQPRKNAPQILSAWVHVTNECNLRCDYCYINKTADDMDEATGYSAVDAIFRSAHKYQFKKVKLKFAGGEATMNLKRVFAIHTYAQEQAQKTRLELETVILTNGVALGERAITEFERRGIRVTISLDGVGEAHDVQRKFANGKGSFRWVSRTLDRLVERGIKPFISITLSNRNAQDLPGVIQYVVERDLPFNINFVRENDCTASFAELRLNDDKVIASLRRAFTVLEENLPSRSLLGSLVDRAQFDQPHDKTCSVGDSYLVIDHKGNIAKCHMEIEKPITSVYADDPLAFIRTDQIGLQNISVEEKDGCRECEWKYWCAGGCPLLTFRVTGRYDVKSPHCRIYKAVYPGLLRLEGLRLLKLADRLS